jgi:hypothetical protein
MAVGLRRFFDAGTIMAVVRRARMRPSPWAITSLSWQKTATRCMFAANRHTVAQRQSGSLPRFNAAVV